MKFIVLGIARSCVCGKCWRVSAIPGEAEKDFHISSPEVRVQPLCSGVLKSQGSKKHMAVPCKAEAGL